MTAAPVIRAVGGSVARRRVQTMVIGMVMLVSTAAATLGLGLVADSHMPFQHAFTAQRGAEVAVDLSTARATPAQLVASTRLAGVTAAAGPFPEATVVFRVQGPPGTGSAAGFSLPPAAIAGRASASGPVDDITLDSGRWAQRPGEIVVSRDLDADGLSLGLGQRITVTGVAGSPRLTIVGIGKSITDTAGGWVTPDELGALRAPGLAVTEQMLYRFRAAGTAAEINSDAAAVTAALPPGAVAGVQSYLAIEAQEIRAISIIEPFVVAFGLLGMVMSVLIVGNVVNGTVVTGYRRIGILKSIGFTPGQVVAAYVGQAAVPALLGCVAGALVGNLLSLPLLSQTAFVYGVGRLPVPAVVYMAALAGMCGFVGAAAVLPALRAGRLSAVQAIATGRAPRQGHGYAAHRLLGRLALPRPVTIGLAAPFARPARTAVTFAAILFGSAAVIFAAGLGSSLARAAAGQSHATTEQVQILLPSRGPGTGRDTEQEIRAQEHAVQAVLGLQPGTLRYVAEAMPHVTVPGLEQPIPAEAFRGNASWTGYDMISGRWYRNPGEVVVNTAFVALTGEAVGATVRLTTGGRSVTARITGEAFDPVNQGPALLASWQTLGGSGAGLYVQQYDVGLQPGTAAQKYAGAVDRALARRLAGVGGPGLTVNINANEPFYLTLIALIGTLTLLLAVVAGLGVFHTVLLSTRDRVHDLGIFKAIGMTPRQMIAMVVCWVAGAGLAAGLAAVPVGTGLHAVVLHEMASAAATGVPASFVHVLSPWELASLALSGLVIAVGAALLPASWAAATKAASILHAE